MNTKKFSEAMGEIDNRYVEKSANYHSKQKKHGWVKWGAMAACLAIIVSTGILISRQTTNPIYPNQDGEVMIETSNLTIYYLSQNNTIESKSIEVFCTPKDIFREWAALNNISNVTFIDCVYDNGGTEKVQGEITKYTAGNYFTLTLTLSAEFSMYAESENGDLLIESLRQTFYDYSYFDEFNLNIL